MKSSNGFQQSGWKNKERILENYENSFDGLNWMDRKIVGRNNFFNELVFSSIDNSSFDDQNLTIEESKTGNYLIIFDNRHIPDSNTQLQEALSIFKESKEVVSTNFQSRKPDEIFQGKKYYFFKDLGIVYTELSKHQLSEVEKQKNFFFVEPERIVQGVKSVNSGKPQINVRNNSNTWGIDYLDLNGGTGLTGKNVKVAVLDTGFDFSHQDFKNRKIISKSFIGNSSQDDNGHGTHCTGVAFGDIDINKQIRYGLAKDTEVYIAKILNKKSHGVMGDIILGIDWAISNDCKVILLSVAISNNGTNIPSVDMHRAVNKAWLNNCLVIAAAGNDSRRTLNDIRPLASPADAQLSISVGAIDQNDNIFNNCNRAKTALGQTMNFVAPGVDIYSSWSTSVGNKMVNHKMMSGTSMAAPWVAGIAALLWEKYPNDICLSIIHKIKALCKKNTNWTNRSDFGDGTPQIP